MNIIITIDANRETRIVAFGLVVSDKRIDIITAFFDWFNEENPSFTNIRAILTDKNQSQIEVLKNTYPNADISLCLFHVFKAMKLETRKKVPASVLQDVRGEKFRNHSIILKLNKNFICNNQVFLLFINKHVDFKLEFFSY